MKIYLVGGAVRDELLGLPVKDRDWVVVGATVVDMIQKGYRQVGKSFPVFLHPDNSEEYALARTERKIAPGYTGFEFNATESVTLEEDLQRRDLTINAIAQTQSKELIDPYGGLQDIQQRILRHISPAFIEDPVRILRVGRFMAQLAYFNFTIAPETLHLMQHMVKVGEVDHLVAERVWQELHASLQATNPGLFFETLKSCDALRILFPALHSFAALTRAVTVTDDTSVRFACLFVGASVEEINQFCKQYRVPKNYQDLAVLVARHLATFAASDQADVSALLDLLQCSDAFRRRARFEKFLLSCQLMLEKGAAQAKRLRQALDLCESVCVRDLVNAGHKGHELAQALHKQRIGVLTSHAI